MTRYGHEERVHGVMEALTPPWFSTTPAPHKLAQLTFVAAALENVRNHRARYDLIINHQYVALRRVEAQRVALAQARQRVRHVPR